jgi:hypothetical protein
MNYFGFKVTPTLTTTKWCKIWMRGQIKMATLGPVYRTSMAQLDNSEEIGQIQQTVAGKKQTLIAEEWVVST